LIHDLGGIRNQLIAFRGPIQNSLAKLCSTEVDPTELADAPIENDQYWIYYADCDHWQVTLEAQ
jgi:hypothetical protein